MATFEEFRKKFDKELAEFAKSGWKSNRDAAFQDGKAFVEKCEPDLERWTKLVADKSLTRDDFEWLIEGKKELAKLEALKKAGLSKVALDRFVNGVIDTVVSIVFKLF